MQGITVWLHGMGPLLEVGTHPLYLGTHPGQQQPYLCNSCPVPSKVLRIIRHVVNGHLKTVPTAVGVASPLCCLEYGTWPLRASVSSLVKWD